MAINAAFFISNSSLSLVSSLPSCLFVGGCEGVVRPLPRPLLEVKSDARKAVEEERALHTKKEK